MKELSVFIDESGDFGEYDDQAPYYIITMVFHDQSQAITDAVQKLDQELSYMDLNDLCIHTGPIVRREETYEFMPITERRRFSTNWLHSFARLTSGINVSVSKRNMRTMLFRPLPSFPEKCHSL